MAEDGVIFVLYRYDPSMAAAVIFIILFLLVSVLHLYQMVRTRTWILTPFVIGGFCISLLQGSYFQQLTNFPIVQLIGYIGVRTHDMPLPQSPDSK
jgi:uncharacterized protein YqhQ